MSRYCINFDCAFNECVAHPNNAKGDNEARYRNFDGNVQVCLKSVKQKVKRTSPTEQFVPTESEEQKTLFEWADRVMFQYPELACLYHIPNEGKRSVAQGANLKREGLREGVSDICLPVKKGKFGSLYIELKRRKGAAVTPAQRNWQALMKRMGNEAHICYGWEEARDRIVEYLELR